MDYFNKLHCELEDHLMVESEYETNARFKCFEPVTFQHIQKVISNLPFKSCKLDPMPTYFLKSNTDDVTPIICHIVNKSMSEGIFPDYLKVRIVLAEEKWIGCK